MTCITQYEFTALIGSDILADGDDWLGCGDTFTMPFGATACITVYDNDHKLSGDARNNEIGDDRRGQIADIELDGVSLHEDAKIYAEEYYVLHDQAGNCFFLIEIEVAGASGTDRQDFYTFYGDVPAPDAQLTVVSSHNVVGNWLAYREMSAGLKWSPADDGKITIEAEDLALSGYRVDDVDAASGGEVIKLRKSDGEASLTFGAATGIYDVEVAYIDENDGQGSIVIEINGVVIETILLTADGDGNGNDNSTISTLTLDNLSLVQGDVITLRGTPDGREFARIDALTFCENRAPVATELVFEGTEDNPVSGILTALDPDGDQFTFGVADNPAHGSLVLAEDGTFTYTPNADFNGSDSFTYIVTDVNGASSTATVTFNVASVNDAPTLASGALNATEDAGIATFDLSALGDDVDADNDGTTLIYTISAAPSEGSATITGTLLTFDPHTGFQDLAAGQSREVIIGITATDAHGASDVNDVTVNVHGTNDAPQVGAALLSGTDEDAAPFTLNLLGGATDVDAGAILSVANIGALPAGLTASGNTLSVDPADASFQSLGLGDSRDIVVSYDVSDEHGAVVPQTLTLTVRGMNDGPQAGIALQSSTDEDAAPFTLNLLEGATDADAGAVLSVTNVSALPDGLSVTGNTLSVNPSDASFQSLGVGDSQDILFSYDISDEHGAVVPQTLTLTMRGTNDGPQVGDTLLSATDEDAAPFTLNLLDGATDVDAGAILSVTNIGTLHAGLSVTGNTLNVDPTDASFQSLGVGDSRDIVVSYEIVDQHGAEVPQTLTLTMHGTNDGPQVAGTLSARVSEDDPALTLDLLQDATDIDRGALLSAANVAEASGLNGWSITGNQITIDPNVFDALNDGETGALSLTYDVIDEHGAATAQSLNVIVDGVTDLPEVVVEVSAGSSAREFILTIDVDPNSADQVDLSIFADLGFADFSLFSGNTIEWGTDGEPTNRIDNPGFGLSDFTGPQTFTLFLERLDQIGEVAIDDGRIIVNAHGFLGGAPIGFGQKVVDVDFDKVVTLNDRAVITTLDQSVYGPGAAPIAEFHEYIPFIGGQREVLTLTGARVLNGPGAASGLDGVVRYTPGTSLDTLAPGTEQIITLEYTFLNQDGEIVVVEDTVTATGGFIFTEFETDHGVFDEATGTITIEAADAADVLLDPFSTGKLTLIDAQLSLNSQEIVTAIFRPMRDEVDAAEAEVARVLANRNAAQVEVNQQAQITAVLTELLAAHAALLAAQLAADLANASANALNEVLNELQSVLNQFRAERDNAFDALINARNRLADVEAEIIATGATVITNPVLIAEKEGLILVGIPALEVALTLADVALLAPQAALDEFFAVNHDIFDALDLANAELAVARTNNDTLLQTLKTLDPSYVGQPFPDADDLVGETALLTDRTVALAGLETALLAAQLAVTTANVALDTAQTAAAFISFDINAEFSVEADITAQIGLQLDFVVDGGSVDTQLEYGLVVTSEYNQTTDVLDLVPFAFNAASDSTVPFSTISPNMQIKAALLYDVNAIVDVLFDASVVTDPLLFGGATTLFDTSPGGDPVTATSVINLEGVIDIVDIDTAQGGTLASGSLLSNIFEYEVNVPTVDTLGAQAAYSQFGADEELFLNADFDFLIDQLVGFVESAALGEEFRAFLNQAGPEIGNGNLQDGLADIDGLVDDFLNANGARLGAQLLQVLSGDLDTDDDGRVPLIVFQTTPDSNEFIHLNTIASPQDVPAIGGDFGFFASFGESDPIVELSFDFDAALAAILNKVAGNTSGVTVNPFDLSLDLENILQIAAVPTDISDAIRSVVDVGASFELADLDFGINTDFSQEFSLSIDDMLFVVDLEDGDRFEFAASDADRLSIANASSHDANNDGVIDYDISMIPKGFFTNDTEVDFGISYAIDFINASLLGQLRFPFEALGLADLVDSTGLGTLLNAADIGFDFGIAGVGIDGDGVAIDLVDLDFGPLITYQGDLDAVRADLFENRFEIDLGEAAFAASVAIQDEFV